MSRVVNSYDLATPDENLRDEIRKLELSPQESEETLTLSSHTHKTHSLLPT